jgi:hypothetical protein
VVALERDDCDKYLDATEPLRRDEGVVDPEWEL